MLPQEPRAPSPDQQALTATWLEPHREVLMRLWQCVRTEVDRILGAKQPIKGGKPYPLGQCLEISQGALQLMRAWLKQDQAPSLPRDAALGFEALCRFLTAGGSLRSVWGVLRDRYFQNAFQLGSWYLDVANDSVDPAKPQVEILPFSASGLVAVADFHQFARIAESYWGGRIYPNHLFPSLAPDFPLLSEVDGIGLRLQVGNDYMIALNRREGFRPARAVLARGAVPEAVRHRIGAVFAEGELGFHPTQGQALALNACATYREQGRQASTEHRDAAVRQYLAVNRRLAEVDKAKAPLQ
ncbi:hypothetical protein [Thiorhodococcus fuscus]|uniref:Uncharacterized protein n=1 Tax=Thiorhodococcus fuscus TaxID=527200 RepID=A0ABW4YDA3_9GAMM